MLMKLHPLGDELIEVVKEGHQYRKGSAYVRFWVSLPFQHGSIERCHILSIALGFLINANTFSMEDVEEDAGHLLNFVEEFEYESLPKGLWGEWNSLVRGLFLSYICDEAWESQFKVLKLWQNAFREVSTSASGSKANRIRMEIALIHAEIRTLELRFRDHLVEVIQEPEQSLNSEYFIECLDSIPFSPGSIERCSILIFVLEFFLNTNAFHMEDQRETAQELLTFYNEFPFESFSENLWWVRWDEWVNNLFYAHFNMDSWWCRPNLSKLSDEARQEVLISTWRADPNQRQEAIRLIHEDMQEWEHSQMEEDLMLGDEYQT